MTHPLNNIVDDFGEWLLGYRTEFSCLYIPQWHYFISTLWLWSADEYGFFMILSESPSLMLTVREYVVVWGLWLACMLLSSQEQHCILCGSDISLQTFEQRPESVSFYLGLVVRSDIFWCGFWIYCNVVFSIFAQPLYRICILYFSLLYT